MKAPEITEELKGDLKVLKMRGSLDPKRFYKKNDRDGFPKYFQVGKKKHGSQTPSVFIFVFLRRTYSTLASEFISLQGFVVCSLYVILTGTIFLCVYVKQVGTVVDNPVDFYHSRVPKKGRKRTMVEELLADAEFRQ